MAVLLIAEHDNASIKDATHKALTAAAQMGGDVHVLVAGNNAGAAAAQAAKLDGVKKVLHVDSSTLERPLAEPMAALIVSLAPAYDHIVSPATGNGKNFMPRVAALLDVMQVSDISEVKSADTFVRLIYAGNAVQTVQSTDPKKVITVRTASFPATGEGGSAETGIHAMSRSFASSASSTRPGGRLPSTRSRLRARSSTAWRCASVGGAPSAEAVAASAAMRCAASSAARWERALCSPSVRIAASASGSEKAPVAGKAPSSSSERSSGTAGS